LDSWTVSVFFLRFANTLQAAEYHVSSKDDDTHDGAKNTPLKIISAAAQKSMGGLPK